MKKAATRWAGRDRKRRKRRGLDMVVSGRSTRDLLQHLVAKSLPRRLKKKRKKKRGAQ